MITTKKDLINVLQKTGFRKIDLCMEQPGTVEITISGFGRFRKLKPDVVSMIRYEKPAAARIKIRRQIFRFLLWEIEI